MVRGVMVAVAALCAAATYPAHGVEAWVGRWAVSPAGCALFGGDTVATAPLTVTDRSVDWMSSNCRIGKMYKLGQAAYIQAHCSGRTNADVPVTLDPRPGDRMRVTWGGKTEEMRRCK